MGNTGSSYEDETKSSGDPWIHAMVDRAFEHYKSGKDDPLAASLHTIAYVLAIHELRAWQMNEKLERIAQALAASLRGESMTVWQVLERLHDWAREWERDRLGIAPGTMGGAIDIINVAYKSSKGIWSGSLYSHETKEVFRVTFRFDTDSLIQILQIGLED